MPRHQLVFSLLALLMLALPGCAGDGGSSVIYSLEGPPLAIAGEQGERAFSGNMERECMLGRGQLAFQAEELSCVGTIKSTPNEAGHIAAIIGCSGGKVLALTFRTLGPDQGIGLGRFFNNSGPTGEAALIFYFHPWEEEARRRLVQEKNTLLDIISKKESS